MTKHLKVLALLIVGLVAVGCGKVDKDKIQGVWELNRTEPKDAKIELRVLRVKDNTYSVMEYRGKERLFSCNNTFETDGDDLKIAEGCGTKAETVKVNSVNDTELVLTKGGVLYFFKKTTARALCVTE